MRTFNVLSLTPAGLLNHPELVGNYLAAPHFSFKRSTGWNYGAIVDFERDLTINGISLRGKSHAEIKKAVFEEVDGEETDEPSLLARVIISTAGGQFCEAPLSTLLARQILLASKPAFITHKKHLATGKTEQWVPVPASEVHFLAPNTQSIGWETDSRDGTKKIVLTYFFAMTSDIESGLPNPMAVKKGETQLSLIPQEEYTAWVLANNDDQPLPFEVEPLVSIHAALQLTQGFSERTQPAVFTQYTHVNLLIHFPDLLIFRHVNGVSKAEPRTTRSADAGFIPSVSGDIPSHSMPEARETSDISGFYGNHKTTLHSFTDLQLDMAGSYYQWDQVNAENATSAIETVRRSMNTSLIPLVQRPIVVEVGNDRGPLFLPNEAKSLQQKLVQLIAEKRCLDSSRLQKKALHDQWLLELTEMQPLLAESDVLGGMKKFQVQTHQPHTAELSLDQCLAAYALLFYPKDNPNFTSELGKHLKARYVNSSAYAQERARYDLLTKIHVYELTQETPLVDQTTKHRFYELTSNRLLTEPFGINLNDRDDERLIGFCRLLFAIRHYCGKQPSVEVIIPVIFTHPNGKVDSSTLIHFTLFRGSLLLTATDEELNEQPVEPHAQSIIYLKAPTQESTSFFKVGDPTAKSKLCELDLCQEINRVFNPGAPKEAYLHHRTVLNYAKKHFKYTTALLDILTQHLDRIPIQRISYSCQTIQAEVSVYLRSIRELSLTEYAVLRQIGDAGLPVHHQEIYEGRPTKLMFKQLNEQIIALRDGLRKQDDYLETYTQKINICYQALESACEIMREPPEIAYPLALAAVERNAILDMENAELRAKTAEMEQQLEILSNQLLELRQERHTADTEEPAEEMYNMGPG